MIDLENRCAAIVLVNNLCFEQQNILLFQAGVQEIVTEMHYLLDKTVCIFRPICKTRRLLVSGKKANSQQGLLHYQAQQCTCTNHTSSSYQSYSI